MERIHFNLNYYFLNLIILGEFKLAAQDTFSSLANFFTECFGWDLIMLKNLRFFQLNDFLYPYANYDYQKALKSFLVSGLFRFPMLDK